MTATKYTTRGANYYPEDIPIAIARGEEFIAGKMQGRESSKSEGKDYGQLPDAWVDIITWDNPTYIVWSYSTPIAWYVPGRNRDIPHWNPYSQKMEAQTYIPAHWAFPNEKYSATTGRHQAKVNRAMEFMPIVLREVNERAED